ncbi:MAG: adenylate/guanylate cyclase domain-containing protein [Rhizobiales bacterium]|nr:adenylate/guanylate cyclase domain-containing protein [Hyphomicrobiales bacterium]MDQ3559998.1 adenylate/guanylate cyclase domain-containing protein [Pseudomonadota bacterium]
MLDLPSASELSRGTGAKGVEYPPDMTLVRRRPISHLGPADGAPLAWLMSGAAADGGPAELLDGLIARLVAAGVPIERATLHMSMLHPQLLGVTANWRADLGVYDEVEVHAHVRETAEHLTSPLRTLIEDRRSVRVDPRDDSAASTYPIMKSLAAAGYTDYWGFALKEAEGRYTLMTLATTAPGGFSDATVETVEALLPAFALNVEIVSRGKVAENVLDAYLGRRSGKRVLAGEIRRGSGETIDAVIWMSDMRDFTGLSDTIDAADMILLLNAYFECLVEAVGATGGEVLKFIGDGMLAIFPISAAHSAHAAAAAALDAARQAVTAVTALKVAVPGPAIVEPAERSLDMAIALHRGSVFFGNIGSKDRLDFTVIGPAVNLAARVEPLAKEVGRRLLLTQQVAALIDEKLEPLGEFGFRGVAGKVSLYAAAEQRVVT